MRKRRILSLLLAVAVTATMLIAVPLTASAFPAKPEGVTRIEAESRSESKKGGDPMKDIPKTALKTTQAVAMCSIILNRDKYCTKMIRLIIHSV